LDALLNADGNHLYALSQFGYYLKQVCPVRENENTSSHIESNWTLSVCQSIIWFVVIDVQCSIAPCLLMLFCCLSASYHSVAMPLPENEGPSTPTPWPSTELQRRWLKVYKVSVVTLG
jgi:hypothetical protein